MNLKKYTKLIIAFIIFILIATGVVYYLNNKPKTAGPAKNVVETMNVATPMTEQDKASLNLSHFGKYEVAARDSNGKITEYKFVGIEKPKPLKLDMMTPEDKKNMKISGDYKLQVLQRGENGEVLSYRVINENSDIVTEY